MRLDVAVAPAFLDADALRECACAVVDVLRATSTITVAMAGGAAAVHPCLSIEEARTRAGASSEKGVLLGGEERGQRIPGFNLGNSPLEYLDPDTVGGRDIFFYTTNGTGTIRRAYAACGRPVHIAALINASAAASALAAAASASDAEGVVIACSGRYGRPSAEDILCAGLVVERVHDIMRSAGLSPEWTDGASIAAGFAASNRRNVLDVLASSEHGRFLRTIGFEEDLEFTSMLDTYDVVPVFDGDRVVRLA